MRNLVAGFPQPSEGRVSVDGRSVAGPGPDRGVVFKDAHLFPWPSVAANVAHGPRMRGVAKRRELDERMAEHLDLVGLGKFGDRLPLELSGGMRQRVSPARMLINQPKAPLMDEPFGALDAQTRMVTQELLLRIGERHRLTVIFVTHDIDQALLLSDRIYTLTSHPGRPHPGMSVPFARAQPRSHPRCGLRAVAARSARAVARRGAPRRDDRLTVARKADGMATGRNPGPRRGWPYHPPSDPGDEPGTVFAIMAGVAALASTPLAGAETADIAIGSGGIAGASAALRAAEGGASVVPVEANSIGWGASGRNVGHVGPASKPTFDQAERCYGPIHGPRFDAASDDGPDPVFGLTERYGIAAEMRRAGMLIAAHSAEARRRMADRARAMSADGKPATFPNGGEAARAIGGDLYLGAFR